MSLFDNQAETDMDRAGALVEQTIQALGIDPAEARVSLPETHCAFGLQRGSAFMQVTIRKPRQSRDYGTIRVVAPVVKLPAADRIPDLSRKLLTLNVKELSGAAFGLADEDVVVVSERSVADLDASEVDAMVRTVGEVADHYDDILAAEFSTELSSAKR